MGITGTQVLQVLGVTWGFSALVRHPRYAPLGGAACRGLSGVWCSTDVQMGRRSFMARLASAFPR